MTMHTPPGVNQQDAESSEQDNVATEPRASLPNAYDGEASGFTGAVNRLIAMSIRHRVAVLAMMLGIAVAGIYAFMTLNTDAFPDLTPNQVLVMTEVRGLSPVEVEQQVSYPMEIALLGLPHTTDVRSISKVGLSVVTVTFTEDIDLFVARSQVQQRIQDAMAQLPSDATSMLGPPATAMGEAYQYLVESSSGAGDSATLLMLSNVQENIIRPMLRTVPGVADVNAWGGLEQQFQVMGDPAKLAGYGLTLEDLETALQRNNANFGAGYLEDRGERITLRGLGRVADTTDIANVVVSTRDATPVYVRDVARVTIGAAPRFGAVTRDARGEALSAVVLLLKGSNGREVIERVTKRFDDIKRVIPPSVRVRPFYSQADVVQRTTQTVFRNLVEGALLVIAVLFLFLRNVRASLLTASIIPLALLVAFLAMKRFGVTANLMSLGALDFGLLVDSAVVVVENAIRRLGSEPNASAARRQLLLREAAFEVGRPIVFGVTIIVAVYIPVFSLGASTIEGKMFTPMAFTVCAAVLASLLLALTYVPAAASYLLVRSTPRIQPPNADGLASDARTRGGRAALSDAHHEPQWFRRLRVRYERILDWALGHRRMVVGGALTMLAVALGSVPFLGTEFMPKLDEGYLLIETRRAPSTSLAEGALISEEVERTLRTFPEV
ncbi:MAG: efflux RND transporter permease subunit, partial [Gemmatimonadaceae bacterium]